MEWLAAMHAPLFLNAVQETYDSPIGNEQASNRREKAEEAKKV